MYSLFHPIYIKLTIMKKLIAVLSSAILLTACGGGGGSSSSENTVKPDSNNIGNTPKDDVITTSLFDVKPDVENCVPGVVSEETKRNFLAAVNEIRALHNLSPVIYDYSADNEMQKTALVMAANKTISHFVGENWSCYTPETLTGAKAANLSIIGKPVNSLNPIEHLASWMDENNSPDLGHRRWILNPFLKKIALGITENKSGGVTLSSSAIKVVYEDDFQLISDSNSTNGFVAYPYGKYPKQYFNSNSFLSFSVFNSPYSFWDNKKVDYSNATILVTDSLNNPQVTKDIAFDNKGYGLANNLQFKIENIKENTTYKVYVSNVLVNGIEQNFDYSFSIE